MGRMRNFSLERADLWREEVWRTDVSYMRRT